MKARIKKTGEIIDVTRNEHGFYVDENCVGYTLNDLDFGNEENEHWQDVRERAAFCVGAQWQKVNLWKDAQGDDLPEIDREVVVLYHPYPCEGNEYTVGFGYRPKEYWDGRNIETDEVTRYYPKRYDKGGWNIPDVKFWLDCYLPKMEE